MVDDSENLNHAVTLFQEAAHVLAQTNINVGTSSSQSKKASTFFSLNGRFCTTLELVIKGKKG